MAESLHNPARSLFAARAMRRPLRAVQHEIAGVRRNEDVECVHHMRVAARRLRNAFGLFAGELPSVARHRWQKQLKDVTKSLGAARDLDVQIDFLRQLLGGLGTASATCRPGIGHVLNSLTARRDAAQDAVLAALDQLESSRTLTGLTRWVKEQPVGSDENTPGSELLRVEAGRAVRDRLGDLFAYEPFVEQPEAVKELHAMRIAAKHLRYTLEAYAPLYSGALAEQIGWMRQLQDWLGEIHDCDVWQVELDEMLAGSPNAPPTRVRLRAGIEFLRRERSQRRAVVYAEFVSAWRRTAATGFWDDFRRPFAVHAAGTVAGAPDECPFQAEAMMTNENAPGRGATPRPAEDLAADERLQPVFELARTCHYEVGHTHQVARLALRLFDKLARLHGLDDERRYWLTCAAVLHDIGWIEGRAGHHKTALRRILESPLLPWDQRLRRIIGSIARYHRKALPSSAHDHFAALSALDQAAVRKLAAILRIADALDYSHASVVADLACRVTAQRLSIRCSVTRAADVECTRAAEKADLAAEVFAKEIRVSWQRR